MYTAMQFMPEDQGEMPGSTFSLALELSDKSDLSAMPEMFEMALSLLSIT
jgi:hypothetical protein